MSPGYDGLSISDSTSILPAADRAALARLSAAEVHSWTTAKADEYRKCILALVAIGNAAAPIHRLSSEVLSRILAQSWHNRNSLRLAHVCRRWRSVILATPEFWVNAIDGDDLTLTAGRPRVRALHGYIDALLKRSGNRPIEPRFKQFDKALHKSLAPHLWRIRSLTVRGLHKVIDILDLIRVLQNGPMPVLEKLVIGHGPERCDCRRGTCQGESDGDCFGVARDAMLPAAVPRLRHVDVPAFTFEQLAVPSLEHVHLRKDVSDTFHGNPSIFRGQLLSLLKRCPGVVTLELSSVLLWTGADDGLPPQDEVALPALRTLRIEDYDVEVVRVFRGLRCSPLHIHVTERDSCTGQEAWLGWDLADAALSTVDRVDMTFRPCNAVIRCYVAGEERLSSLSWRGVSAFVGIFHKPLVTELDLSYFVIQSAPGECRSLLRDFVHLRRLTIRGQGVWQVLADLLPPSSNPVQEDVACRHLEKLVLGSHSYQDPLWDALSGRSTVAPKSFDGFRRRCSQIGTTLAALARFGLRLTNLELYESNTTDRSGLSSCRVLDMTPVLLSAVESGLQPLQELVERPVVFSGFRLESKRNGQYY